MRQSHCKRILDRSTERLEMPFGTTVQIQTASRAALVSLKREEPVRQGRTRAGSNRLQGQLINISTDVHVTAVIHFRPRSYQPCP